MSMGRSESQRLHSKLMWRILTTSQIVDRIHTIHHQWKCITPGCLVQLKSTPWDNFLVMIVKRSVFTLEFEILVMFVIRFLFSNFYFYHSKCRAVIKNKKGHSITHPHSQHTYTRASHLTHLISNALRTHLFTQQSHYSHPITIFSSDLKNERNKD